MLTSVGRGKRHREREKRQKILCSMPSTEPDGRLDLRTKRS